MRKLVKTFLAVTVVAWAFALPVSAATLTIVDSITVNGVTSDTTWTLTIDDGCIVCSASLEAEFEDPAGSGVNGYTGTYLDSVQWVVSDPNVNPTAVSLDATNAGLTTDWDFDIDESLNANGCGGGAQDAICGEWISGGTGNGFGAIVNGSTLFWDFTVTFDSILTEAEEGNIRAAFNRANGKNFNIFSPGGGSFSTEIVTTTSEIVPEPTLLTLLGGGLLIAGRRLRRKTT